MTSKAKTFLTWVFIAFILTLIYIMIRKGILEQQYIKYIKNNTEKIVLSLTGFEKDKKLRDKNLPGFYELIKKKYDIAFIAAADKNRILKAGKDERYIKSTEIFDSIIESFLKNEFNKSGGNNFLIRYYDQSRFYIFERNVSGGRILLVFPRRLSIKIHIQLLGEFLLLIICSVIITSAVFMIRNRSARREILDSVKNEGRLKNKKHIEVKKTEDKIQLKEERLINKQETAEPAADKSDIHFNILTENIFEVFREISGEYKPNEFYFYAVDKNSEIAKLFEFKGSAFIKVTDRELLDLDMEIIDEMKNSSFILLNKGTNVSIPVIYENKLMGIARMVRDKQFMGPEINDIKNMLGKIAEYLDNYLSAK